jgi:hypothetical protein
MAGTVFGARGEMVDTAMLFFVMAGFIPAIHVFGRYVVKTWMPGTSPGMTNQRFVTSSPVRPD